MFELYPYHEYKLYRIFHKKEGRWYAQLVKPGTTGSKTERTTMSYARYEMSVKLKRKLLKHEHVDHKDENKVNDHPDNLQILSSLENTTIKNILHYWINIAKAST